MICHVTIFIIDQLVAGLRREIGNKLDYEWSPFFLRDSGANETRARVKITPRKKGETRWGGRKTPFSRGVIFMRARVSLALLSLRKNGDYS